MTATGSALRNDHLEFRPGRALSRRTSPGTSRKASARSIGRVPATSGRGSSLTPTVPRRSVVRRPAVAVDVGAVLWVGRPLGVRITAR
jgi:hypothetical protein